MANQTISKNSFVLLDNWPGVAWQGGDLPTGGFTATAHQNVATAAYPLGTKICVLCDDTDYTAVGYSTMAYLKLTGADTYTVTAKHLCLPDTTNPYEMTNNDGSHVTLSGLAGYAISAMTTGRYGWFWVGGICPEQHVTALTGTFSTSSALSVGGIIGSTITEGATVGTFGLTSKATYVDVAFGYALVNDS